MLVVVVVVVYLNLSSFKWQMFADVSFMWFSIKAALTQPPDVRTFTQYVLCCGRFCGLLFSLTLFLFCFFLKAHARAFIINRALATKFANNNYNNNNEEKSKQACNFICTSAHRNALGKNSGNLFKLENYVNTFLFHLLHIPPPLFHHTCKKKCFV